MYCIEHWSGVLTFEMDININILNYEHYLKET